MIVTSSMFDTLNQIDDVDAATSLDAPANDIGNRLIEIYYNTTNLVTRELITEFMTQAGNVWLRKLLLRDTGPIQSSLEPYASLDDYVSLLAANDDDVVCELTG